jgi:hypothetical protein
MVSGKTLCRVGGTVLLAVVATLCTAGIANAEQNSLRFDGSNDYVTFGAATGVGGLGAATFTLECWFFREGAGVTASTGTGGVTAVPLITKGRGEAEASNVDMNYFLGIRGTDGVLVADFEEGATGSSPGLNHPIAGVTPVVTGQWYHAAVTYDGTTWKLYLNGSLENQLTVGQPPRSDSIQHAGLGTAMTSTGAAAGFFQGIIEEPRVWNYARTQTEIQDNMNLELTSGTGLIGRWGLNEGTGTTAANSVSGGVDGTLTNGPVWVVSSPFVTNYSFKFGASNAYVTFGNATQLGLAQFTLECWFRRDGAGTAVSTGTGGVTAIPLVTKGAAQADGSNLDMNYFLGIRGSDGVLAADFEEGATGASPGLNHPIVGVTPIVTGQWYHAAVTYDGTTWKLYLNGVLENRLTVGQSPRSDSIQHAGLATSMTSTGAAAGFFNGTLDEVRVWNYARSVVQIDAAISSPISTAQPGLVARWALDEGAGNKVYGSAGTAVTGTVTGSGWAWDRPAPFDIVVTPTPPEAPTGLTATAVSQSEIGLAWVNNSIEETRLEIWRSTTGSGGPFDSLTSVALGTTSYQDLALSPTTEYCYRVRAANEVGVSDWTNVACATTPAEAPYALDFTGTDGYVTFGQAPSLGLGQFTLEGWFRRDGAGTTANTGTGGVYAIPLITKGVGEAEASNVDMNYFLGIRGTDGVLAADFEEGATGASPGQNHPIVGVTPVVTGQWYHAAVTYDGATWKLYLNGALENQLTVGQPPRSDSIQHAGLATAMNSTGAPSGYFDGVLDEVRIWNYARTQAQIFETINSEISTPQTGLVARWGLNEGTGTAVHGSAGTSVNGTIMNTGWSWLAGGAPFDIAPPEPPAAPSGLTATAISYSEIDLAWTDNSDNETRFEIWRSTSGSGGPFDSVTSVAAGATSYEDHAVASYTEYCYRVRAGNIAGVSDWTSVDCATTLAEAPHALDFAGTDGYVTFGQAPSLGLAEFTLEGWFRRDGAGTTANTGTGGVLAIPLITKGVGEADDDNRDMNYFFGIRGTDGVLAADFEEGAGGTDPGLNHPIVGVTPIVTGQWYHGAVTYDGTTWKLYLDGMLESELAVGLPPRSDSIQHAGLATALNSTGASSGYFDGVLDEVRIWNYARSQAQIQAAINSEITSPQTGLVARWGLNEGAGSVVYGSAGTSVNGTIMNSGWSWMDGGAPFDIVIDYPPNPPALNGPADGAMDVAMPPTLDVTVSDTEGSPLAVNFYGRPVSGVTHEPFTLIHIPDTQNYAASASGGTPAMFRSQTKWVVDNLGGYNIAFVDHVGDIVENGDTYPAQWDSIWTAMSLLEDPVTTGLTYGIPYVVTVGNHDQTPNGDAAGTTAYYNTFFGSDHFAGRPYYGGHFKSNNDASFSFFSASGFDFIVVSMEYDTSPDADVLAWADSIVAAYPTRWAIVSVHNLVGTGNPASFSSQGSAVYNALKDNPNLILMIGGHNPGEGRRSDTYNGHTVHSILADYQSRTNGGNGWFRIMKFYPDEGVVRVKTYSPWLDQYEADADSSSQFTLPIELQPLADWQLIGTVTGVASGANATIQWAGLSASTQYEWYATVNDGHSTVTGPTWEFTTAPANEPPVASVVYPNGGETFDVGDHCLVEWSATDDVAVTSIDLLVSRSGTGGPFETIATGVSNTGSYDWTVTSPASVDAVVKVVAHDGGGLTGEDASDTAFTIIEPVAGPYEISVVPAERLTNCSTPVTYTFHIAKEGAGTPIRGYDVKFDVDDAIVTIATPATDVVQLPYLSSAGGTTFYVVDNGGGTYTVSCAILGPTTGKTGDGDLFTVTFTPVAGGSSDVSMVELKLRDVNNQPIEVTGVGGAVRVDCAPPTMQAIVEAQGRCYNHAPTFGVFAFRDDVGLDTAEYEIDDDGWNWIFPSWPDTVWTSPGWELPGFDGLGQGEHTVHFRVKDDAGNYNAGTLSWTFVKDTEAPAAPTNFTALPGHDKVHLAWTNPTDPSLAGVEIRRVAWGDYADYATAPPVYPENPGEGTLVAQTDLAAYDDAVTPRDIYYYAAFAYDCAGNYSAAAPTSRDRSTNYWLGDIDPASTGNGTIDLVDLSLFAALFGTVQGSGGWNEESDFGPTDDYSRFGIPLPDDVVDFEDLMILAMNYMNVSPEAASGDVIALTGSVPLGDQVSFSLLPVSRDNGKTTYAVMIDNGSEVLKGFSLKVAYGAGNALEGITASRELAGKGPEHFFGVIEREPGVAEICVAALGVNSPFEYTGEVARVVVRETTGGSAALKTADLRDLNNGRDEVALPGADETPYIPMTTALLQNHPNPFNPTTTITYDVAAAGPVRIDIYDVSGRLVRTLVNGSKDRGRYAVEWDGRDTNGAQVTTGVYFSRMSAPGYTSHAKKMVLLK